MKTSRTPETVRRLPKPPSDTEKHVSQALAQPYAESDAAVRTMAAPVLTSMLMRP